MLVSFLLAGHYALAASSLMRENPTVDEVNHLPAGISYWQTGSFRLYHHNPPLIKLAAALPVVLAGGELREAYQSKVWKGDSVPPAAFGSFFLMLNIGRYFELFTLARLVMPLFSILGGWVVYAWSRRLFGDRGGLLSLAMWCLCPNVLAHARLITSDVGATALGVSATYVFWLYLKTPSWKRAAIAGVVLGLAQLSKFSMLLLYPLWPVVWVLDGSWKSGPKCWMRAAGHGAAIVALSVLTIDLGYGFEGVGRPIGSYNFASRSFLTRPGTTPGRSNNDLIQLFWRHRVNRFRGTWIGPLPSPLPWHYLLGFDEQKIEADGIPKAWLSSGTTDPDAVQGYPVYLDGVLRHHGWKSYYARCLLYKTPEGTLALLALAVGVVAASRRSRADLGGEAALLVLPLASFGAITFLTDINLGLRYVLPIFPYAFVFAGRLGRWADGLTPSPRRAAWGLIGLLLMATAGSVASIHPHYLAYFNHASGGPDRDPPRLIDSNLDWGQDMVGLREWARAHPDSGPIGLAYFGQVPPNLFAARNDGFAWFLPPARPGTVFPMGNDTSKLIGQAARVEPGIYAISATLRNGLPWRVYDPAFDPRTGLFSSVWDARDDAFSYFRSAKPFDRIGHSILLYRLSAGDAARLERERTGGISPPPSP